MKNKVWYIFEVIGARDFHYERYLQDNSSVGESRAFEECCNLNKNHCGIKLYRVESESETYAY